MLYQYDGSFFIRIFLDGGSSFLAQQMVYIRQARSHIRFLDRAVEVFPVLLIQLTNQVGLLFQ